MADYDSINTEPGIMETSGVPRRILGAPTMEDNVRASINQDSRLAGSPTLSVAGINQKLPAEFKNLQLINYGTNTQRVYRGFEEICPMAEAGCVLSKNPDKFWKLCATKDFFTCSHLDEIIAGGAMKSPFAFLRGESE